MSSQNIDPANVTNPEHAEHHIVQPKTYIAVYVTLLIFTGITVGAAFVDLHVVMLFFMHVIYQSKLIKLTVSAGFFTFLILITMTLTDYISRAWGLW
jgi:cytochrome c oxidase subunit IV